MGKLLCFKVQIKNTAQTAEFRFWWTPSIPPVAGEERKKNGCFPPDRLQLRTNSVKQVVSHHQQAAFKNIDKQQRKRFYSSLIEWTSITSGFCTETKYIQLYIHLAGIYARAPDVKHMNQDKEIN